MMLDDKGEQFQIPVSLPDKTKSIKAKVDMPIADPYKTLTQDAKEHTEYNILQGDEMGVFQGRNCLQHALANREGSKCGFGTQRQLPFEVHQSEMQWRRNCL